MLKSCAQIDIFTRQGVFNCSNTYTRKEVTEISCGYRTSTNTAVLVWKDDANGQSDVFDTVPVCTGISRGDGRKPLPQALGKAVIDAVCCDDESA
eukprot:2368424-Amphidinium_carterae.1